MEQWAGGHENYTFQELNSTTTLTVGNIEINREEYKIIKDGEEIILPRKEFELFYLLATKPAKVFTREEILDKVWGNEVVVGGRTIDVHKIGRAHV